MPETFRGKAAQRRQTKIEPKRLSSRQRGYDARWDRLSAAFRRQNPFCRFCEQDGLRVVFCDVVDHIVPVIDRPDLRYEWANLQSLCHGHHSGLKAWLEDQARRTGDLNVLVVWSADPSRRPKRRGEVSHGPGGL